MFTKFIAFLKIIIYFFFCVEYRFGEDMLEIVNILLTKNNETLSFSL
jgi:hypothetical protein